MRYLKFWNAYNYNKYKFKKPKIIINQKSPLQNKYIKKLLLLDNKKISDKICVFTLKFKTQTNFLKTSRFKLAHDLTFNKNQSFIKKC